MRRTVVSFHAHPDDEALLTGGTLARASAQGHRVILVVATDGEAGLAASALRPDLGARRSDELDAAAAALGCARLVRLGFPDSGWRDSARDDPHVFSRLSVAEAAVPLAELLREEHADVLTTYDAAGGYGHPDHRQVHRVGAEAARQARTPVVLQATLPRERLHRAVRLGARVPGLLDSVDPHDFLRAFTPRSAITHTIDVRDHLGEKRAAMAAHVSQTTSDVGPRTLDLLLRLPSPILRAVVGHEWFVDASRPQARARDVFDGL
ncbi:MAG TPA: PIG-L family deacetylase [Actinomycetales bacterium]|nr:PIG-L family deacetylase [Actinomycetales bacterium]